MILSMGIALLSMIGVAAAAPHSNDGEFERFFFPTWGVVAGSAWLLTFSGLVFAWRRYPLKFARVMESNNANPGLRVISDEHDALWLVSARMLRGNPIADQLERVCIIDEVRIARPRREFYIRFEAKMDFGGGFKTSTPIHRKAVVVPLDVVSQVRRGLILVRGLDIRAYPFIESKSAASRPRYSADRTGGAE
jgi:hypothetical protein